MNRLARFTVAMMVTLLSSLAFAAETEQTTMMTEVPEEVREKNQLAPAEQKKLDAETKRAAADFEAAAKAAKEAEKQRNPS